jgi:hypothetical protein
VKCEIFHKFFNPSLFLPRDEKKSKVEREQKITQTSEFSSLAVFCSGKVEGGRFEVKFKL